MNKEENYKSRIKKALNIIIIVFSVIFLLIIFNVINIKEISVIVNCKFILNNGTNVINNNINTKNEKEIIKSAINIFKSNENITGLTKYGACINELRLVNKDNPINYALLKLLYSQ